MLSQDGSTNGATFSRSFRYRTLTTARQLGTSHIEFGSKNKHLQACTNNVEPPFPHLAYQSYTCYPPSQLPSLIGMSS